MSYLCNKSKYSFFDKLRALLLNLDLNHYCKLSRSPRAGRWTCKKCGEQVSWDI